MVCLCLAIRLTLSQRSLSFCALQVKCMQCSYCSDTFDPFLDLSLEIVKADTLCKALSHFISEEQLDGGEKQYHCPLCNQKVRALKKLTIHKAPNVLTIHLKRFGSHASGQKIGKQVEFEPELNLKPYVTDPLVSCWFLLSEFVMLEIARRHLKVCSHVSHFQEGDLKYTLYGVLVHAGYGTHSGHYYCFIRTSSGMWYSLNDDQVKKILFFVGYYYFVHCLRYGRRGTSVHYFY